MVAETVNVTGQTNSAQFKVPNCNLSSDMGSLFETSSFSDCLLIAGTPDTPTVSFKVNYSRFRSQSFQVHKAVLATRSPVFKAMFETGLAESSSNEIRVEDQDPDVMKEMLYFMYTGMCPNVDQMAQHLIAAADKYHLDRLKVGFFRKKEEICSGYV